MGNLCPGTNNAVTIEPSVEENSITRRNNLQKDKMLKSASCVGVGSYNAFDSRESSSDSDNEKIDIKGKTLVLTRFRSDKKTRLAHLV